MKLGHLKLIAFQFGLKVSDDPIRQIFVTRLCQMDTIPAQPVLRVAAHCSICSSTEVDPIEVVIFSM